MAFIQDQPTKEVIQSIRKPLHGPRTPAAVDNPMIAKSGASLYLSWSAVTRDARGYPQAADHYRIYRDTSRTFHPGALVLVDSTAGLSYLDDAAGHVGHTGANCFYVLTAVAGGKESLPSRGFGEIDHYVSPTK